MESYTSYFEGWGWGGGVTWCPLEDDCQQRTEQTAIAAVAQGFIHKN